MNDMTAPVIDMVSQIKQQATKNRIQALKMVFTAGQGHIGGDFSSMDILVTLYKAVLNVCPENPTKPDRDRFIMSKGHCTGAFYSTLAHSGFFPVEELKTYMEPLSRLNGHPDRKKIPGVETNTGPLGHGMPVAVGTAIASKLQGNLWRTFVITGDGELQEGSNWESAMSAAHYELDNLTVIIDRNRLQQGAKTEETNSLEPLGDKWRAFGWSVKEVDGHNYEELLSVFNSLPFEKDKPNCIIANTHKGEGVSFMRDSVAWHHRVPNQEEFELALKELEEVLI